MKKISTQVLRASASVTATDTGAAVDVSAFQGIGRILLNSGAMGGTTPTSAVKLQHSDDGSTGWTDVPGAAFAQVTTTASAQEIDLNTDAFKKFVRVVNTVAGTTPTQAYGVTLVGIKQ